MTWVKSCSILWLAALSALAQTNVVTYHNDNARTGQYLNELLLSPSNVAPGQFGKRFTLPVDGAVYAQPLYLARVKVAGKALHNILFVVTAHDSIYAFDADDESTTGTQPLWKVSLIDASNNVTTVPAADVNCPVIPELGILGTPVIDSVAGTLYLIAETKEQGNSYVFRLHALDVANGSERAGSPAVIQPAGFVPVLHKQRTALLLANGVIYSSWSGHCDLGAFHGWVLAHDATSLQPVGVFNDTPTDRGASFWSGGSGPAGDTDGSVFVVSANGDFDGNIPASRYDESVLKLSAAPQLTVADMFAPFNQETLDAGDFDLGSSGALLLPDETGSAAHPRLLFTSGKEGRLYLLDRQNLGGAQTGSDAKALASLPVLKTATFGSAAYFNGSIFLGPKDSPMVAFPVAAAELASTPSAQGSTSLGVQGATPSISANGSQNGLVWAISGNNGGTLIGYRASDLTEVFNSSLQPTDALGGYAEFAVPAIADGKVFAGTFSTVSIYGELNNTPPVIAGITNAASFATNAIAPGSLISIFGTGLAASAVSAPGLPLPLSITDVSVVVNGLEAPLLAVSPGQINAQVPSALSAGPATVVVRVSGSQSTPASITLSAAAPGIFTQAHGQAAAVNANGSLNQAHNPATDGSVVSVFFTGQGPVGQAVDDGAPAPSAPLASATSPITATIGGLPAPIQFAGLAPGWSGLAQINLKVPALSSGTYPVLITIGAVTSNPGNLSVQ